MTRNKSMNLDILDLGLKAIKTRSDAELELFRADVRFLSGAENCLPIGILESPVAEFSSETTEAKPSFDDLVTQVVQRQRAGYNIRLDNFGITIDLKEAYCTYAEALTNPSNFARGSDAITWWNQGGIIGWWRHTVLKRLSPRRYSEMGEWQLRGSRMRQQAVLNAVLAEDEA